MRQGGNGNRENNVKGRRSFGNQTRKNNSPKTLPYDFIPFIEGNEYYYPWKTEDLPSHDKREKLYKSGTIHYTVTPKSPLVMELRKKPNDKSKYFVSGSALRGKIRSNVEILSGSYPEFVDTSEMLYRNITKKEYRDKLIKSTDQSALSTDTEPNSKDKQKDKRIEYFVQAGFLQKRENGFVVVPAKNVGDRYFSSIKEYEFFGAKNAKLSKFENLCMLDWKPYLIKWVQDLNEEIDVLSKEIYSIRQKNSDKMKECQNVLDDIFTKKFSFLNNSIKNCSQSDFTNKEEEVRQELKDAIPIFQDEEEREKLCEKYAKRWKYKLEIHHKKIKENGNYKPYQRRIFFHATEKGTITRFCNPGTNRNEEQFLTGYMYNSYAIHSKRSHYVIGEPLQNGVEYNVPEALINKYNNMLKKMHDYKTFKNIKENGTQENEEEFFYNLFCDEIYDTNLSNDRNNIRDGLIVFFKTDGKVVKEIGRTPYFKVTTDYSIEELLQSRHSNDSNCVDFANSLFGYVNSENNDMPAYKSRLIFSALDIVGEVETPIEKDFILQSPSATAYSIYLKQNDIKRFQTFLNSGKGRPKLRGYKYYHIRNKPISSHPDNENKTFKNNNSSEPKIYSKKYVTEIKGIDGLGEGYLKGKIHFRNLNDEEIGLVLLAIQIDLLPFKEDLRPLYEAIGAAKSYGYGKVALELEKMEIESNQSEFEILLGGNQNVNQYTTREDFQPFVQKFKDKVGGWSHFDNIFINHYVSSKQEFTDDIQGYQVGEFWFKTKQDGLKPLEFKEENDVILDNKPKDLNTSELALLNNLKNFFDNKRM